MATKSKYYVTTPIFYANGLPHIGHLITTTIADVLARHHRTKLGNDNVFFTTGLDEHGTTVEESAKKEGFQDYQKYVDQRADFWKKAFNDTNISYNYFVRTTNKKHEKFAQNFIRKLIKAGDVYKNTYQGKYCYGCEKFLTLSDLNEKGLCQYHRKDQVIKVEEENYFFKLSKYAQKVKTLIENNTINIQPPNKRNEILARIKSGIEDQSISRPKEKVSWGIEFPDDSNQTIYVWIEALLNYLSSLEINQKQDYWTSSFHILGKDINWFHNLIWPAMLLSANYPVHKGSFVHSILNIEGQKISKSLGNVISPKELINKYGIDGTRYLLLSNIPYKNDTDVTLDTLNTKYNADLANGLGNLIARVAKLCEKSNIEFPIKKKIQSFNHLEQLLENYQFNEALSYIWENQIRTADQYISKQKPWKLEGDKLKKVLTKLVIDIQQIAHNLKPFLPKTAEKISKQFQGPQIKSQAPLFPRI